MRKVKEQSYDYTVFFDLNEDGGYTVTVPALPGLVTEGEDLEDAKKMAKDAIKCYIDGMKKAKENIPLETESVQLRLRVKA